ncbi:hypothetical protein QD712_06620 [Streptomyces acidiscabies]|uniref:hypothetical protein n=1 Tax=Streptomyces acidiscabies TaxID=42234 RepID=UPI0030D39987
MASNFPKFDLWKSEKQILGRDEGVVDVSNHFGGPPDDMRLRDIFRAPHRRPDLTGPPIVPKDPLPAWAGPRIKGWDPDLRFEPFPYLRRADLTVPVAPSAASTDADVYESTDGSQKWALPRYLLVLDRVGGVDEPRITIADREGVATLLLTLTTAPSPASGPGIGTLSHSVVVSLAYRLPVAGGGGEMTHKLEFTKITWDLPRMVAELPLTAPGLSGQLLAAMSSPAADMRLAVMRRIFVGVPTDYRMEDTGEFAYQERVLELDWVSPPTPLVLSPAQLERLGGEAGPVSPMRRLRISFDGRGHSYWQDPVRPEQFFFVPDRFLLARTPTGPALRVRAADAASEADIRITAEFFARAVTDPRRLEQARPTLEDRARADGAVRPVRVAVLPEAQPVLRLALPEGGAAPSALTSRPGALIDLELGVTHAETLKYGDFRLVYEALLGSSLSLLRGEVRIGADGDQPEDIPLELRLENMVGDALTLTLGEVGTDRITGTLANGTESPARVDRLGVSAVLGDREVPLRVEGLAAGRRLAPDERAEIVLVPGEPLPAGGPDRIVLDQSGVVTEPDRKAVWDRVYDRTADPQLTRAIQVEAVASMFTALDRPTDRVTAFIVVVQNGGTVRLTETELSAETTVRTPIQPLLTGVPVPPLRYQTQTWWQSGGVGESAWRETSATILVPLRTAPAS